MVFTNSRALINSTTHTYNSSTDLFYGTTINIQSKALIVEQRLNKKNTYAYFGINRVNVT